VLGILVHGDNHWIVEGPLPSPGRARELARQWDLPGIEPAGGTAKAPSEERWRLRLKAFREDLEWAVTLDADAPATEAVVCLLEELVARGVRIHRAPGPLRPADGVAAWDGAD
jgi:hypothetical protein